MPSQLTTEKVKATVREIYQDQYDLSRLVYKGMKSRIQIGCNIHGFVEVDPQRFIYKGHGCELCRKDTLLKERRYSNEEYITRMKALFGDQYDYSKFDYKGQREKVIIICEIHGEVEVYLNNFIRKGCNKCAFIKRGEKRRITLNEYVRNLDSRHPNVSIQFKELDQDLVSEFKCEEHGFFQKLPRNALKSGCPECSTRKKTNKRRTPQEKFIQRVREIHGDRYDLSKIDYVNAKTHVILICKIHGEFKITPDNLLSNNRGCRSCSGNLSSNLIYGSEGLSLKIIKERVNKLYGNLIKIVDDTYVNLQQEADWVCSRHGRIKGKPRNVLKTNPCVQCRNEEIDIKRKEKAKVYWLEKRKHLEELYHHQFDYSETVFINNQTKIKIRCKDHGYFEVLLQNHLKDSNCRGCSNETFGRRIADHNKLDSSELIRRFRKKHGDKYNYSKVLHKHIDTPVTIICEIHGPFFQTPHIHLQGKGCQECGRSNARDKSLSTTEHIIEVFKEAHGDLYDYSLVEYSGNMIPVKIICQVHGVFEQLPNIHRQGKGCKQCSLSKGEMRIARVLEERSIEFEVEYPVYNKKTSRHLRFDFFLPQVPCFIEFQGEQHYRPVNFGGMSDQNAESVHQEIVKRDLIKKQMAKELSIDLFEISFEDTVEEKLLEILEKIDSWGLSSI